MYSRFARFCFVVVAFLFAVVLISASSHVQSDSGGGSFGTDEGSSLTSVQFNLGAAAVDTRRGLQSALGSIVNAIAYVPRHVASFVARATDVRAFIKPADAMEVPVIVPMRNIATLPAEPIALAPVAAPAAPPAPVVKPKVTTAAATKSVPAGANRYARGNCTWWVFQKRAQAGKTIPNSWGNAATWASRAARDGYVVNHTPSPGSIMQTRNSARGLGHVAYVESVEPNGTWHISEMNAVGFGVVSRRAMPPSAAASYNFIHER